MFDGAFAAVDIKEGELVEKGLMRRLPEGFDGNTCPYIFTWSTERPNKVSLPYVLCLLFVVLERARRVLQMCMDAGMFVTNATALFVYCILVLTETGLAVAPCNCRSMQT